MDTSRCWGWIRWLAVLLSVTLLASACSTSDDSDGAGGEGPADEAVVEPSDELVEALARAGIPVWREPGTDALAAPAEPVSPVQLLAWQAAVIEREAEAGGGIPTNLLDREIDADGDGPPEGLDTTPSKMILNWARLGETPAAEYAQEVLGDTLESDTDDELLPQLVLVLFTADIAALASEFPEPIEVTDHEPGTEPEGTTDPSEKPGKGSDETGAPASTGVRAGDSGPRFFRSASFGSPATVSTPSPLQSAPCSAAARFVSESVSWVFNQIGHLKSAALKKPGIFVIDQIVDVVNFVGEIVVGGVNFVIDGAHLVIDKVVKVAIDSILDYVGKIAATVGTISMIASYIRPWTLHIDPPNLLTDAPNSDTATARIDLGGLDEWPAWAQDCATQAGKPLPPLRPEGNQVTWQLAHPLISPGDIQTTLQPGGTASYTYTVNAEPPGDDFVTDDATLHVEVQRDDTREIQEAFSGLIRAELGTTIGQIVYGFIQPFAQRLLDKAFDTLAHLRDIPGRKRITIRYGDGDDEPDEPPDTGPGTDLSPETVRGQVPRACPPAGVMSAAQRHRDSEFAQSQYGPWEHVGAVLEDHLLDVPNSTTCGYSSWIGPVYFDGVGDNRAVDLIGLYLLGAVAPESSDDRVVDVPGADRAWFAGGALYAAVDERTLVVMTLGFHGDEWEAAALAVARRVLGVG